jgi:hypothetical protein
MADELTLYFAVGLIDPSSKSLSDELIAELDTRKQFSKDLYGVLFTTCLQNDALKYSSIDEIANPLKVNTDFVKDKARTLEIALQNVLVSNGKVPDQFIEEVENYISSSRNYVDLISPPVAMNREVKDLAMHLDQSPIDIYVVQGDRRTACFVDKLASKLVNIYAQDKKQNNLLVAKQMLLH